MVWRCQVPDMLGGWIMSEQSRRLRCLAVIPARGGSKGIPRKNIRLLAGRPLIEYSIAAALQATSVDRCVVSTDDQEIAAISRTAGAEVIMRPEGLARDDTPTLPVVRHVVETVKQGDYHPDVVLTLQPTSPLRQPRHIDEAMAIFAADPEADSLVSCIEVPHIYHPNSVMRQDKMGYLRPYLGGDLILRRQEKGRVFARNGAAIYITRMSCLDQFIFGGNLLAYPMAQSDSIDIDHESDLQMAEQEILRRS